MSPTARSWEGGNQDSVGFAPRGLRLSFRLFTGAEGQQTRNHGTAGSVAEVAEPAGVQPDDPGFRRTCTTQVRPPSVKYGPTHDLGKGVGRDLRPRPEPVQHGPAEGDPDCAQAGIHGRTPGNEAQRKPYVHGIRHGGPHHAAISLAHEHQSGGRNQRTDLQVNETPCQGFLLSGFIADCDGFALSQP